MVESKKRRRGHGEGGIFQRESDGRWVSRIRLEGGGYLRDHLRVLAQRVDRRGPPCPPMSSEVLKGLAESAP